MRTVTITDRIKWFEQLNWIYKKCDKVVDMTNWAMWSLGLDDIHVMLTDKDATWFILRWA